MQVEQIEQRMRLIESRIEAHTEALIAAYNKLKSLVENSNLQIPIEDIQATIQSLEALKNR